MRKAILGLCLLISSSAFADAGSFFVDPHIAVGYNVAQGTHFLLGLDTGYNWSENVAFGIGAFYSAGEHPDDDREIGGGPFATYYQPIASFLVAHVREDIDYIDQRDPINISGTNDYTYETETGMASITTAGLHFILTPNLGVSAGYQWVLALSNSDLGKDRSGFFAGFSIGI